MKRDDFIIRFAGEGGQGMVTSADGLAQAASMAGFHVQTFSTFPSQILGGPTWTQTRISTRSVRSAGDQIDVLVCFNREAYDNHKDEVAADGVIIYNQGDFQLDGDGKSFGIPFEELAKSTGNARAENMVVIGAFAHLVNMPQEFLDEFVTKRFTRGRTGDDEIIRSNIEAMLLGRSHAAASGFTPRGNGAPCEARIPPDSHQGQRGRFGRCSGRGRQLLRRLPHLPRHANPHLHGAKPGPERATSPTRPARRSKLSMRSSVPATLARRR